MKMIRMRQAKTIAYSIALFTLLSVCAVFAQSAPSTSYIISLANPEQHLAEVQITLPPGPATRELQLPVWNALYQVRDFAQFVNWVRAKDTGGRPLPVRLLNKSRWQVNDAASGATVEYQIYLDSPGPFGAQLNAHHAFLNLAQVLMYAVDARNSPMQVQFTHVPAEWHIATPLTSSRNTYNAENYDLLVDSPFELGMFQEFDFDESGGHFRVIIDADSADYDSAKIVSTLHHIVAAALSWMNDRPFDTYTFFYHFPRGPGGGGMEHAFSTAIELNADLLKQNLENLSSVTAHEFFHLWNVKRIRPQSLEPIDYTQENYTRALWFSEGVTSTAAGTIELRAGLADEPQYLAYVGEQIGELERRPARLTQSAEQSSLDAWLEGFGYYRRPERSISYYNIGELLGILLDLSVRQSTHDQASLREVLQWMNANCAKKGLFFNDSEGVRRAAETVSHADMGWFFSRYVAGTGEIPWNDFFGYVGLRVETSSKTLPDPGFTTSRNFDGPMAVISVTPGSDAERAGLHIGDTIEEIMGQPAGIESRAQLSRLVPGDTLSVKVKSRRGVDHDLMWKVGARQEVSYQLKDIDQVTPEQRAHRRAWLKGEAEGPTTMEPGAQ
jgi:predicted metalloprotease with PDZ domain